MDPNLVSGIVFFGAGTVAQVALLVRKKGFIDYAQHGRWLWRMHGRPTPKQNLRQDHLVAAVMQAMGFAFLIAVVL